jgi:alkanesulfonate monooxygenase SsuD/methylene tetrahydromethanopterin reductase-like flavin-dependent oxidoreductase (luciferase family)
VELAILSLGDIQTNPETGHRFAARQRIDEIIGFAVLADRLGLDLFALGEHHTEDFAVSSPAVVLAAIAARTSTIRLTSAVTVLSVLDPVRVYQDFATLDLVSHGRAEIIAGRYRPPLQDAPIAPRAEQNPLPVWAGVGGSPASAVRAGRLGQPMVLGFIGGSFAHARNTIDAYRTAGEQAGHSEKLRVGISTHFFAATTPSAARAVYPYYREYLRPKPPTGRGFHVDQAQFLAGAQPGQAIMVGSVDELIDKVVEAHEVLGIDRFIGQVDWGGLPPSMVEESISRFATEIAPTVRAAVKPAGI